MNFLNNLRSRYSFNFLVVVGLINLLSWLFVCVEPSKKPPFFEILNLGMVLLFVFLAMLVYLIVSIFVAILLHIFLKQKIKNNDFMKSKLIFFLQIIGILSIIATFAFLLYLLFLYFGLS